MAIINNALWLLLDSRHSGGIETHVLELADGLRQHNINVQVVFLNHYGVHPLRAALQHKHIVTISLDGSIRALWRELGKQSPALIHTHGYKAGIFGRLCARLSSTPVVSTYHSGERSYGRLALYNLLDRYSASLATKVYVVSPEIGLRLRVPFDLANNFIATKTLKASTGNQVAFVGRLSHEKGPDIYLDLARCFPEQSFHIYGTGPLEQALKDSAPSNVYFHGQQDDMATIWSDIGLLIMPSRFEGLPMAALEAMGRGIPVIAFNVGALSHLIKPNENGWLVEPIKQEQLSQYFQRWLEMNPTTKQRYQHAAQNTVNRKFSTHVVIPELIRAYQQMSLVEMDNGL
jgi:glycosyltransferase involved in cell wall biosynthesis